MRALDTARSCSSGAAPDKARLCSFDPERLFAEFTAKGVDFVVIGGIAATLHGAARPTQDVDVLVARDGGNLARPSTALESLQAALSACTEEPIKLSRQELLHRGSRLVALTEGAESECLLDHAEK